MPAVAGEHGAIAGPGGRLVQQSHGRVIVQADHLGFGVVVVFQVVFVATEQNAIAMHSRQGFPCLV